LVDTYAVDAVEGSDTDEELARGASLARVVQLVPSSRSGATLTVGFTTFPGLVVRYGKWHVEAYPHCGCDACDESPDYLARDFADRVDLLAKGRFREKLTLSGWLTFEFSEMGSGETRLGIREALSRGAPSRSAWEAWRRRPPQGRPPGEAQA
jgi:hypothetical protein